MSKRVGFSATDYEVHYLDHLVASGLFGRTRSDVVRRLVDEGLRRAAVDGFVHVLPAGAKAPKR